LNAKGDQVLQDKPNRKQTAKSASDTGIPHPAGEEMQALLHELQKSQSELEQQKTDLSQVRAELRETRDKYLVLYDYAPSGYVTLNIQGIISDANLTVSELFGVDKSELNGSSLFQYIQPSHQPSFKLHLESVFLSGVQQKCDLEMKNKNGDIFYAKIESVAIRDEEGILSQSRTAITDITSFKKYEELSRYQDRIIEISTDAIIIADKELNIIKWNQAAERMLGWKKEEVTGTSATPQASQRIFEILTKGDVMKSLEERGSWVGKGTGYKKDNSTVDILISVGVLCDLSGIFNGVAVIYHTYSQSQGEQSFLPGQDTESDLNSRMEELTKANRVLHQELNVHKQEALLAKESEGKNRDLVDNIKLGIFRSMQGPQGKLLEVNRAMEDITGYSREELLQTDLCSLLSGIDPNPVFSNDINVTDWKVTRELLLTRKDGSKITVSETIVAIRFDSGSVQYFDGILEDITERKQAQIQIQQSLERLQKTIKEIIQAMAYIGEVRDPYTAGHQRRVAQLGIEIAKAMGLEAYQYEGLTMAAFVHDIGKILVPSDILSKPGELTKPEIEMLRDHSRIGYEILKTIEFPWPIAKIVLQHHERMNGSGYPLGLSGDQIIIESRILAVADVVEAMSSHRPYRPALGVDKALEEINRNRGTLYDSNVVDACIKLFMDKSFYLN
jgi:PAS domain S-box-containing protein